MKALKIRVLEENDYEQTLVGWWKDWGWQAPDKDFLPENGKGGFIVLDGDTPICAGFLYVTNSKVAWVDWIISNKNYNQKTKRNDALNLLVSTLTNVAKSSGNKYAYALIKHPNLIIRYKEHGYLQGDSYVGEMIKTL